MAELNTEDLQNMKGVLKNDEHLKKLEEFMNADPNYVPSNKELLDMLNSADMDEDMRQSLKSMLAGDVPQFFGGTGSGTTLAILFVVIIFSIICKLFRVFQYKLLIFLGFFAVKLKRSHCLRHFVKKIELNS